MQNNYIPVIFGCSTTSLTKDEKQFFRNSKPLGFILFSKNIDNPQQVKKLVAEMREITDHNNVLILIDQEGGRVARLTSPHWKDFPSAAMFASIENLDEAKKAVYLNYREIGVTLKELGINVNCAPVLDIPVEGSDNIVGDRAFGNTPEQVTALAREACRGLLDEKVSPILKHIPGHGRATSDSHKTLPVIDTPVKLLETSDFIPFKELSDMPMAMTAHIKYTDIDSEECLTLSKCGISMIRKKIGFKGLLFTDDLSMKALNGSFAERTKKALNAGCDVILHCNGEMTEMEEIARVL